MVTYRNVKRDGMGGGLHSKGEREVGSIKRTLWKMGH